MFHIIIATSQIERDQCYAIRHKVYVEEQKVPVELEIDEHDETDATHFLATFDGKPAGTARLCFIDGVAKIQRVAILKEHRGNGYGREIISRVLATIRKDGRTKNVALDAQVYAQGLYLAFGFVPVGEEFDDAGIPHIRMEKQL